MTKLQLQLTDGNKSLGKLDLSPVLHLRLFAFAKTNRLSIARMIQRSIEFTVAPDGADSELSCPEEEEIVEMAAQMIRP